MFEPTLTSPNFSFGPLFMWIVTKMTTYDFLSAKQAILSNVWTASNFT